MARESKRQEGQGLKGKEPQRKEPQPKEPQPKTPHRKTQEHDSLSVGNVSKRSGVAVSTLHFYESKGLITSWRNNGNQRRFSKDVLRRVAVIKSAQRIGISLQGIQDAMSTLPEQRTPNKQDWAKLSRHWRQELDERIRQLNQLRDELGECIGCGCLSLKACPLRNPEDIAGQEHSGAVFLDAE